jgi:ferredoxin
MTEQLLIYLDDGTGVFRARQTGLPVNVFTFFDADSDGRADVFSSIGGETEHHSVRRQLSDDDGDGVELAADRCPTLSGSAPTGCPSAGLIAAMPVRVARAGRRIVVRTGVRATCPPAGTVCTGRAVVKMGLRTLSLAKLSIGSGKTASVVLPLRRGASRSLADGRPHRITIALYLTGPDQRTVRTSRRVRVKRRL